MYYFTLNSMAGFGDDNKPFFTLNIFVKSEAEMVVLEELEALRASGGMVILGKRGEGWMGGVAAPKEFEMPRAQGGMVILVKRGVEWMRGVVVLEPARSKRTWLVTGWRKTVGGTDCCGIFHNTFEAMVALAGICGRIPRHLWMKERGSVWWEKVSSQCYPATEFKSMFRMSRDTFEMLCGELTTAVAKGDTPQYKTIPVRKRIAVCIWRLASGEPLRQVSVRFGIGISTCHKISLEVCTAIKNLLMPKFLVWPKGPSMAVIATQFEAAYEIPDLVGVIYNTHIPIIAPTRNTTFYDKHHLTRGMKKPSYSITVQAVVDADGSFTNICVGYPGSMSDEEVLFQSFLNWKLGGQIQGQGKWLLGGSSYPVTDWILAPYTVRNHTFLTRMFNKKVTEACMVAKDAIMRFKARWKFLQKHGGMNLEDFSIMVSACCVLHNICERNGDTLDPQLVIDIVEDKMLAKKPVHSDAGSLVRDNITNNLFLYGRDNKISDFMY